MSDEYPKYELRMREGAVGLMTGGNAQLFVDGKKIPFVRKVKVEVEAGGLARMTLEVLGQFEVSGGFEPVIQVPLEVSSDQSQE